MTGGVAGWCYVSGGLIGVYGARGFVTPSRISTALGRVQNMTRPGCCPTGGSRGFVLLSPNRTGSGRALALKTPTRT